MRVTIKLENQEEVKRAIKLLGKKYNAGLKIAIQQGAIHVEGEAKETTAWSNVSGELRSDITHEVKTIGDQHRGRIGTNKEYGKWLEFGTSRMPAHPWLIPAFKNSARAILGFLTAQIKKAKI